MSSTVTFIGKNGTRGVSRSLSEPLSKRLGPTSPALGLAASTDEEIRYRDNRHQPAQARPLTRYLPVRDRSLDLRCFVESSGHSLDDCSQQVLVTPTTCCGYLKKQGGRGFRTWHKRWFVFDRSKRCLMSYYDRTETKLRRSIYFQTIVDVFVDHLRTVLSPNPKLTFCLKTVDRRYYLVAPTGEAMRVWIDVLFTGAEGYKEFW